MNTKGVHNKASTNHSSLEVFLCVMTRTENLANDFDVVSHFCNQLAYSTENVLSLQY